MPSNAELAALTKKCIAGNQPCRGHLLIMEASNFDQSNITMEPPDGVSCDEVMPISAFMGENASGQRVTITCWKITKEELEELHRNGGRVWLTILGLGMPPVTLTTENPFRDSQSNPVSESKT